MIYARHSPIRDGVVDFYLNFPAGNPKLRAPKWVMGIPVRRNSAAALKQVESALLNGQIKQFPAVSTPSSHSNRKLTSIKTVKLRAQHAHGAAWPSGGHAGAAVCEGGTRGSTES